LTSPSPIPSALTNDYKNSRLEEQIKWHSQKARYNKSRFRLYEIIVIFAGAIIPIINVVDFFGLSDVYNLFCLGRYNCRSYWYFSVREVSRELDIIQDYYRTLEKGKILL